MSKSKSRETYYGDDHVFTTRGVSENNEICLKSTPGLTLCIDGRITLANGADTQVMFNDDGNLVGDEEFVFNKTTGQISTFFKTPLTPSYTFHQNTDTGMYSNSFGAVRFACSGVFAGGFIAGGLQCTDGNAANPSIHFFNDPDVGFYRKGTNNLGITAGSFEALSVSTTETNIKNDLVLAAGSPTNPSLYFNNFPDTGFFNNSGADSIMATIDGEEFLRVVPNDTNAQEAVVQFSSTSTRFNCSFNNKSLTSHTYISFRNQSATGVQTTVGSIFWDGSFTIYATSDYRLKDNIVYMEPESSLDKIMQLKPCNYNWKSTGVLSEGFLAHEVRSIFPESAMTTGEKDGEEYQFLDFTKMIPYMVSAMKEQTEMIKKLEARITVLESA
jgi:hypothetical protein